MFAGGILPTESLADEKSSGSGDPNPFFGIRGKIGYRSRQSFTVPLRNKADVFVRFYQFSKSGSLRANYRQPGFHRLKEHQTKAFGKTGQAKDIAPL